MPKIIFVTIAVFLCYVVEFLLFNLIAPWVTPNLMLLLVAFFTLYFGKSYGIYSAVLAGLLRDSFAANPFGVHIFSFVVCVLFIRFFKKYIYHVGSAEGRVLLVLFIIVINGVIQLCFWGGFEVVHVIRIFRSVFFPEILLTLFLSPVLFRYLKECALKLSV